METVKNVIFIACALGIVSTLLDISAPEGSAKNQLLVIAGIITLLCVISPFTGGGFKLAVDEFSLEEKTEYYSGKLDEKTREAVLSSAREQYEEYFINKLNSNNIETEYVSILLNISANNQVNADKLTVKLSDPEQSQEAERLIKQDLPLIQIVFVTEDNNEAEA
ncbi:MAG: hypothetical protein J5994_07085 [Ruminococcus sp.]|nr:hypothetical protein [Ruminococcus sp.]